MVVAGAGEPGGAGATGDGGAASSVEPYPWYPALDLAEIPFHTGAGEWGAQHTVAAPEAPRTTGNEVLAATAAELAEAMGTPGRVVRVTASISQRVIVAAPISDIDLVIPPGVVLSGGILLGICAVPSETKRLRLRGTTPGSHSGGIVGGIGLCGSDGISDLIIDGIDMNGPLDFAHPVTRAAVVNLRAHTEASWFLGGATDIVFAGINVMSSARPRGTAQAEGWGVRLHGGTAVVFQSRIQGTRYHKLRIHSEPAHDTLLWATQNAFVDTHEARIFTALYGYHPYDPNLGTSPAYNEFHGGVWVQDNHVYAGADLNGCADLREFSSGAAPYARITDNDVRGVLTPRSANDEAADGPNVDNTTGNTYAAWLAPPAWGEPGDPTSVPLPPVNVEVCQQAGPRPACDCWVEVEGCPCQ